MVFVFLFLAFGRPFPTFCRCFSLFRLFFFIYLQRLKTNNKELRQKIGCKNKTEKEELLENKKTKRKETARSRKNNGCYENEEELPKLEEEKEEETVIDFYQPEVNSQK